MTEAAEVTYSPAWGPMVTLTRSADGSYRAVLQVDGLAPQRGVTASEAIAGIESLDPPTVRVQYRRVARDAWRELIRLAGRAVAASCTSTTGDTGGIRAVLMTHFRVALAMRGALRRIDEEI